MKKFKSLLSLFFTMFKIGLFTFGGGYAMISFFENEFVNKKKLLNKNEFIDLVAIAESTPGPISINCSTYIGYKAEKFWGAVVSTIGVCLPSFVLIYLISLFFNAFIDISWIAATFKGIQICVIFLILSAGFSLFKQMQKSALTITLFIITFICMILLSLLSIKFSSIYYILLAIVFALILHLISCLQNKKNQKKSNNKEENQ